VILIDTNVICELMRPAPAPTVLNWFAAHEPAELFLSAVSEAELRTGAAILPPGKRRDSDGRSRYGSSAELFGKDGRVTVIRC